MLSTLQEKMAGAPPAIWVIGDLMLDRYLTGSVSRVSPEAPAPVLLLQETSGRLGGAANVAQNILALGGKAALGGVMGTDEAGDELAALLDSVGVGSSGVLRSSQSITTVKQRALASGHQLLRIDREKPRALSTEEVTAILDGLSRDLPNPAVIIVSDYDKGVVSRALVTELAARTPGVPIFVDPKVRDVSRYVGAHVITPNEKEAALATGVEIRDDVSLRHAAAHLAERLPGAEILITRGASGMALYTRSGELVTSPAKARRVFDVTGAGDVAMATLALARAWGLDWPDALHMANVAAGIAVGKIGAVPVYAAELLGGLSRSQFGLKLVDRPSLAELRHSASAMGQRIVFTNGCFDLLHVGHLHLLENARALGDLLVVGINADASVRRLKGAERPIVTEHDRAELLAGLEAVDFVTIFAEDTPIETMRVLKPDVLVKGGDYTLDQVVGGDEVRAWGGKVATVPFVKGRSTTSLIEASRRSGTGG